MFVLMVTLHLACFLEDIIGFSNSNKTALELGLRA
jgi:hypothetical protein